MKIILLALLGLCSIISSNSRLIEKITDRTLTTETKTGSSAPVRLARAADISHEEEILTGISDREDRLHSDEFLQPNNKKVRQFAAPDTDNTGLMRVVRKPRESGERVERTGKNVTLSSASSPITQTRTRTKTALVKKPIPKYNEMDYDDDFQMKINKSPVKVIDSGEHEDEDFNLNDYDFDVNHDEFVGRGKPLEPRIKHKDINSYPVRHEPKPVVAPEIKIKSKLNIPTSHRGASIKRERSAEINKKQSEKEDYYDESATTKANDKARDLEDDFNEENEESKEYDSKVSNVRLVRSPWKVSNFAAKVGEKTSGLSKVLSILPMFPQVPNKDRGVEDEVNTNDAWSKRH